MIYSSFVWLTISFAATSGAQESTAPTTAKRASPAGTSPSKNSGRATPQSLSQKKAGSPVQPEKKNQSERATFGAGCFWHVEHVFERLKGVNWAVSGYAGGNVPYPSYEMVHEGSTGHAEVVMVDFNPDVIGYEDLLKVFWKCHDPTSINRQGEDEGPQYRSVIFYHNEEQRRAALDSYRELTAARVYRSPIVTQLAPLTTFYRAEDYHQNYYGGKPRASTRRKTPAARIKKSRKNQGQAAPPVVKPADTHPSESTPIKAGALLEPTDLLSGRNTG